jgi:hypothetical protein
MLHHWNALMSRFTAYSIAALIVLALPAVLASSSAPAVAHAACWISVGPKSPFENREEYLGHFSSQIAEKKCEAGDILIIHALPAPSSIAAAFCDYRQSVTFEQDRFVPDHISTTLTCAFLGLRRPDRSK